MTRTIEATAAGAVMGVVAGGSAVSGVAMIVATWGTSGPWLTLGVGLIQLAAIGSAATYFAGKRGNLDDAFQAGYQSGFYKGERVKPKVIRMSDHDRSA